MQTTVITDPMEITPAITGNWLYRLRPGHKVYLCKEQTIATIETIFVPTRPYPYAQNPHKSRYGHIHLNINNYSHDWTVSADGNGFDGKPLLSPIRGNILSPDEISPAVSALTLSRTKLTHHRLIRISRPSETLLNHYPSAIRIHTDLQIEIPDSTIIAEANLVYSTDFDSNHYLIEEDESFINYNNEWHQAITFIDGSRVWVKETGERIYHIIPLEDTIQNKLITIATNLMLDW